MVSRSPTLAALSYTPAGMPSVQYRACSSHKMTQALMRHRGPVTASQLVKLLAQFHTLCYISLPCCNMSY
jgi:hypothetical protein